MMNLFSYVIIPGITLLMPGNSRWLESNFSVVGSRSAGRLFLILWGFLTGGFFYCHLHKTIGRFSLFLPAAKERLLTDCAAALLLVSVFLPYLPGQLPIQSALHVVFAFTASVLLYLALVFMAVRMYRLYPDFFFLQASALLAVIPVCLYLFFLGGAMINSAMEIYFTIACCVWLHRFHQRLARAARELQLK